MKLSLKLSAKKFALSVLVALQISSAAFAKDFEMRILPHADAPMYDLSDVAGETSYYDYVRETLGPKMQEMAPKGRKDNETELKAGRGVSVKLSENNYNIHINFPNAATGGRSYGWTEGKIGDWSDAMYLDKLYAVATSGDKKDLAAFYVNVITILGASDSSGIEDLDHETQRVAANFLAIYTAEAYRAMVPDAHMNWDDALLETTLLGAFHGGQSEFAMFYTGEFTSTTKQQAAGVYNRGRAGTLADDAKDKEATMRDYWQFSANPESRQSGINITRADFEKMGQAITAYEAKAGNKTMAKIFKVVGGDQKNVIKAISQFFTKGQSNNISKIPGLAQDVSDFMMQVHEDADAITESLQ